MYEAKMSDNVAKHDAGVDRMRHNARWARSDSWTSLAKKVKQRTRDFVWVADGDVVRPALDRDEFCVGYVCLDFRGVTVRYDLVRRTLHVRRVPINPLPSSQGR